MRFEPKRGERALKSVNGLLQFELRTAAAVTGLTFLDEALPEDGQGLHGNFLRAAHRAPPFLL